MYLTNFKNNKNKFFYGVNLVQINKINFNWCKLQNKFFNDVNQNNQNKLLTDVNYKIIKYIV